MHVKHHKKRNIVTSFLSLMFNNIESLCKKKIIKEGLPSLMISLVGLIFAGESLDRMQHWPFFNNVPEIFILVPILLGLKGDLEMTLAARLSTSANLGLLDNRSSSSALSFSRKTPHTKQILNHTFFQLFSSKAVTTNVPGSSHNVSWSIIYGNIAVVQIQAVIIGFISGAWSWFLGGLTHGDFNGGINRAALICACGIICAAASSFILGVIMCWIVIVCRRNHVDPDNIVIPIAASLGDLVMVWALASCGIYFEYVGASPLSPYLIILVSFLLLPFWASKVTKNPNVKNILTEGWVPLLLSVLFSGFAGLALEKYLGVFPNLALLVPVLNGLTGNVASIYASKLSTSLHRQKIKFSKTHNNNTHDDDNYENNHEYSARNKLLSATSTASSSITDMVIEMEDCNPSENKFNQECNIQTVRIVKETFAPGVEKGSTTASTAPVVPQKVYTPSSITLNKNVSRTNAPELSKGEINIYDKTLPLTIISLLVGWFFMIFIYIFNIGSVDVSIPLFTMYTVVTLILTKMLLVFAQKITIYFWNKGLDPDTNTLPYITSMADVAGTIMLIFGYLLIDLYLGGKLTNEVIKTPAHNRPNYRLGVGLPRRKQKKVHNVVHESIKQLLK